MPTEDHPIPPDVLLTIGLSLTAISLLVSWLKVRRYRRYANAPGVVIEVVECISDLKNETTFAPKISFKTDLGQTVEFVSSLSSSWKPTVGKSVMVLYDPADPKDATVDEFFTKYFVQLIFLAFGLTSLVLSLVLFLRGR